MSVYKKLMDARIELQKTELKKSGLNKFAGYQYFELGDFLPQTQQIFVKLGLAGVVSFATDLATLTIRDVDSQDTILITSPMASASLKGCHEIQNLGASQTYLRRYLWVTAMEIVEHDVLDATTGKETARGKPTDNPEFQPDEEETKYLMGFVTTISALETDIPAATECFYDSNLDKDEQVWVWNKLQPFSALRAAMKKHNTERKTK